MTVAQAMMTNLKTLAAAKTSRNLPLPVMDHHAFAELLDFSAIEDIQSRSAAGIWTGSRRQADGGNAAHLGEGQECGLMDGAVPRWRWRRRDCSVSRCRRGRPITGSASSPRTPAPLAFAGQSYWRGAQLAAEEINASGMLGTGNRISLPDKESASDPARAIQAMHQFIADRTVLATSCCILSPVVGSVKPVVLNAKMPLIIFGATAPGLPQPPLVYSMTILPGPKDVATAKDVVEAREAEDRRLFRRRRQRRVQGTARGRAEGGRGGGRQDRGRDQRALLRYRFHRAGDAGHGHEARR